uniref:Uncharacterized protein n=1 Tax=Nymphaea colorata TaxID=210225 RepID=A0A5K1E7I9_9MAGN
MAINEDILNRPGCPAGYGSGPGHTFFLSGSTLVSPARSDILTGRAWPGYHFLNPARPNGPLGRRRRARRGRRRREGDGDEEQEERRLCIVYFQSLLPSMISNSRVKTPISVANAAVIQQQEVRRRV